MPERTYLDTSINIGILITALTILIGGAMKWQKLEDDIHHEIESRVIEDEHTRKTVNDAHTVIGRAIENLSDRLQKLTDIENEDHKRNPTGWRDK